MYLHTHAQEEGPDTYVLHINATEAVQLVEAVEGALVASPEAENFAVTLGFVDHGTDAHVHEFEGDDTTSVLDHEHDDNGNCIIPPSGLILPGE